MMAEQGTESTTNSMEQLLERWAGETVELAATFGIHDTVGIVELFGDPILTQAAVALRIGQGETVSTPLTEAAKNSLRAFAQRPAEKPPGALSWLDLRTSKNKGGSQS